MMLLPRYRRPPTSPPGRPRTPPPLIHAVNSAMTKSYNTGGTYSSCDSIKGITKVKDIADERRRAYFTIYCGGKLFTKAARYRNKCNKKSVIRITIDKENVQENVIDDVLTDTLIEATHLVPINSSYLQTLEVEIIDDGKVREKVCFDFDVSEVFSVNHAYVINTRQFYTTLEDCAYYFDSLINGKMIFLCAASNERPARQSDEFLPTFRAIRPLTESRLSRQSSLDFPDRRPRGLRCVSAINRAEYVVVDIESVGFEITNEAREAFNTDGDDAEIYYCAVRIGNSWKASSFDFHPNQSVEDSGRISVTFFERFVFEFDRTLAAKLCVLRCDRATGQDELVGCGSLLPYVHSTQWACRTLSVAKCAE
eukprot:GHVO01034509.1.p1 GENE.GHVO01034509.1~~GHVO01034509.1.p1  ORF type:complete len:367 (+),score=34.13 GHVO01034509.1:500-1600(+)